MESTTNWCRVLWFLLASSLATALVVLIVQGPPPPIDATVFQPPLRSVPVLHLDDACYTDLTKSGDELWYSVVPKNHGYVLATNLTSGLHFWSDVAMFHQLRCLALVRQGLMGLATPAKSNDNSHGSGFTDAIGSCFDYLRQGILCSGDTTLNMIADVQIAEDKRVHIMDGNAIWHQCKDADPVYSWAERSGEPKRSELIFLEQFQRRNNRDSGSGRSTL